MKIIFLNTWNGKQTNSISHFLQSHKNDTDVFCLQEVYDDCMRKITLSHLHEYTEIYKYQYGFKDEKDIEDYAQGTYIRKDIKTIKSDIVFGESPVSGLGITVDIDLNGQTLHILNYHGISRPKDKLDTDARFVQSQKIVSYYSNLSGLKILGGDFNFLPETKSYNLFIEHGYKELIKFNNIPTTRNHLYWDNRPQKHLYSDYIFTSPNVNVKNLTVPNLEISDHLPLILEILV